MYIERRVYRKAFEAYIRRGTPIALSLKQEQSTTHYIWRTQRDGRVRSTHAEREGEIYSWEKPPIGGHPGEAPNCRCVAEPYLPNVIEKVEHVLNVSSPSGSRWNDYHLVKHFFLDGGRSVTLSEIGHQSEIAHSWAYNKGALDRWSEQIIDKVRAENIRGYFSHNFNTSYKFGDVQYSHGGGAIEGVFTGNVNEKNGSLNIQGKTEYKFSDIFTDPASARTFIAYVRNNFAKVVYFLRTVGADLNFLDRPDRKPQEFNENDVHRIFMIITDIGGTAYTITGNWTSNLNAVVSVVNEDL